MQYMLLIYTGEARNGFQSLPKEQQQAITEEYMAIMRDPGVSAGAQLQPGPTVPTECEPAISGVAAR